VAEDRGDGRIGDVQEEPGEQAEDHDGGEQRRPRQPLGAVDVLDVVPAHSSFGTPKAVRWNIQSR